MMYEDVKKINSLADFDWSDRACVLVLYKYAQKGHWAENLDFLMTIDELACLEEKKRYLEVELPRVIQSMQDKRVQVNMESCFKDKQDFSERSFGKSFCQRAMGGKKNEINCLPYVQIIQRIKAVNVKPRMVDHLEKLKEKIKKSQDKILEYIDNDVINVSGKIRNEWLAIYGAHPSAIHSDGMKIFFPRIKELVDEKLRAFINCEHNKSQFIEIDRAIKPLSFEFIQAYNARGDGQQQKRNLFFYNPDSKKECPQLQEEQKTLD